MTIISSIIKRDITLATRKLGDTANMLMFYLLVSCLFVFGIGSLPQNTALIAPAVVWVCALLAQVISLERIIAEDLADGTLEQLILQGDLPEKIVIARMISNWITVSLPIIIFSPIVAILFGLTWHTTGMLLLSLMCGTPLLSIISVTCAFLTIGIRKSEAIFSIIALPLYIPVLIFGASALHNHSLFYTNMLLLAAMVLFMLPLGIAAGVVAIRVAIE